MKYFWVVVENYYVDKNINTVFAVRGKGFLSFSEWGVHSIVCYYKCYDKVEVLAHYKRGDRVELHKFVVDKDTFIDRSLNVKELPEEVIKHAEKHDRLIIDEEYLQL